MSPETQRRLGVVVCVSSGVFLALLGGLHSLRPDLDPSWRFISEYARGDFGWLMSLAFTALAVACLSGLWVFRQAAGGWPGRIGAVLLGISSLGMLMAAVFVTDPINTPTDRLSLSGALHSLGGGLNFTTLAVIALTLGLARNERWQGSVALLWLLAGLGLLADLAFVVSASAAGDGFGPGNYTGLLGRIVMVSVAAWMITAGAHAIRLAVVRNPLVRPVAGLGRH